VIVDLALHVSARLQVEAFNVAKLAWEPVLDPWPFQVRHGD
jgi:hypothetical protein